LYGSSCCEKNRTQNPNKRPLLVVVIIIQMRHVFEIRPGKTDTTYTMREAYPAVQVLAGVCVPDCVALAHGQNTTFCGCCLLTIQDVAKSAA
jgi:hypothetical protein